MNNEKSPKNSSIPADLQPYYDERRTSTMAWARWVTRILAVIILICIIVLFIRWVWHQTHTTSTTKPQTGTSQKVGSGTSSVSPDDTQFPGQISVGGSANSNAQSGQTSTSSNSTTGITNTQSSTSNQATQSTLTNTGPGQTITVFFVATICFALLYELKLHRQN